jgi:hypothetical protein
VHWIETRSAGQNQATYLMRSAEFVGKGPMYLYGLGPTLLNLMHGAIQLAHEGGPIISKGVVQLHSDGIMEEIPDQRPPVENPQLARQELHWTDRRSRAKAYLVRLGSLGGSRPPPPPAGTSPAQLLLDRASSDEQIAKILTWFGAPPSAENSYRAAEAIRDFLGGKPNMTKAYGTKMDDFNLAWRSANVYRHTNIPVFVGMLEPIQIQRVIADAASFALDVAPDQWSPGRGAIRLVKQLARCVPLAWTAHAPHRFASE